MTMTTAEVGAQLRLLHELRMLRDQEVARQLTAGFGLELRKGIITARDPGSYTCSVLLGAADLAEENPGAAIPGFTIAAGVYPRVGDACFVAMNGPSPCVLFKFGPVGTARVWKSTAGSTASGTTGPTAAVNFTTVIHDTDGLWNPAANDRLTIPWPGLWSVGGNNQWDFGSTAGFRETSLWWNNGSDSGSIRRLKQHQSHAAIELGQPVSDEFVLDAGEWLQLRVVQTTGGVYGIGTSSPEEDYPVLSATWLSPP